jgi:hypothetical protein
MRLIECEDNNWYDLGCLCLLLFPFGFRSERRRLDCSGLEELGELIECDGGRKILTACRRGIPWNIGFRRFRRPILVLGS